MLLKKRGNLNKNEKWKLEGEETEVKDEIKYLGVTLLRRATWKKERNWWHSEEGWRCVVLMRV